MLVGLLADTHIPYRATKLPAPILESLHGVDLILHAGDVDEPWALAPLQEIAPVYAVRGNYHLLDLSSGGRTLPEVVEIELAGFQVVLTHGNPSGLASWGWKIISSLRQLAGHNDYPAQDRTIVQPLLNRFPKPI